jgi:hypothetical protein
MMLDLFKPVPASFAPAFWTKKTSSVGGYLYLVNVPVRVRTDAYQTDQTTASWNRGSFALEAINVSDTFEPRSSRKASS